MIRQYDDSYTYLKKLYTQKQNNYMTLRIKNAKSIINTKCPKSFSTLRTKMKTAQNQRYNAEQDPVKNYEIKKNNILLYNKLLDIDKNNTKKISKSLNATYKFRKHTKEEHVKNKIKVLAQENLFILKKLLTKHSSYNITQLEKDYKQSRKYLKNICKFPTINFNNYKTFGLPSLSVGIFIPTL